MLTTPVVILSAYADAPKDCSVASLTGSSFADLNHAPSETNPGRAVASSHEPREEILGDHDVCATGCRPRREDPPDVSLMAPSASVLSRPGASAVAAQFTGLTANDDKPVAPTYERTAFPVVPIGEAPDRTFELRNASCFVLTFSGNLVLNFKKIREPFHSVKVEEQRSWSLDHTRLPITMTEEAGNSKRRSETFLGNGTASQGSRRKLDVKALGTPIKRGRFQSRHRLSGSHSSTQSELNALSSWCREYV